MDFMDVSRLLWRLFLCVALIAGALGLYLVFAISPDDYRQGATVKIMYVHVPVAWLSLWVWIVMAISASCTLIWRHPLAAISSKAAAPIGASFTLITLITGSLWGKPTWGTWWQWDARLTSVLVLLVMYLGVILLWRKIEEQEKADRIVSVFILLGTINIPIIKFSVYWWNTLHQRASILRRGGPTVDTEMLYPLLIMTLMFVSLFFCLHLLDMRRRVLDARVHALEIQQYTGGL